MSLISVLLCIFLALLIETDVSAAFSVHHQSRRVLVRRLPPTRASASISKRLTHPRQRAHVILTMSQRDTSESLNDTSSLNNAVLSIGSTTSMFVAITFFVLLAVKRDALMVSFFIGAINNGILSKVLKKLLNQERPAEISETVKDKPSDKGMPSSHAMSLGFIGTFTAMTLPQTLLPILIYVAVSLYYRIHTQLHTKEQIAVGLGVGVLNGALWRSLCSGTNPLFPSVNVMEWVSSTFLNEHGLLPIPLLVIPAVVGLAVVGSFERRISKWIKKSD
jgi:membrane-associated phospholipid phosphatase